MPNHALRDLPEDVRSKIRTGHINLADRPLSEIFQENCDHAAGSELHQVSAAVNAVQAGIDGYEPI